MGAQIPEIGISDMPNVEIPEMYFLSSVKLQYSCPDAAIVRKVVQNSIDARSTRILVFFVYVVPPHQAVASIPWQGACSTKGEKLPIRIRLQS